MTHPESQSLALIRNVRAHYEMRGFSPVAIDMLCDEILERSSDIGLRTASGRWESIDSLLDVFEPIEQSPQPAILHPEPAAIFALSFGYRLDSPFARVPEDRQPGKNNLALAAQLERCHRIFPEAWVAVQHEIGLALLTPTPAGEGYGPDPLKADLLSPARDWTTTEVLSYFINNLPDRVFELSRSILIVSHLHHYGRCAFILSRAGFEPLIAPKEAVAYAGYDEREAQPRFRSSWEYLLNDFLSLCKTSRGAQTLAGPQIPRHP